jgi:putative flippase GtrA
MSKPGHDALRPLRFVVNGAICTVIHYATLALLLESGLLGLAGLANLLASAVGILASFVGNRYFVFRQETQRWTAQLWRFWLLYISLAGMQGVILFLWTDLARQNYSIGFVIGAAAAAIGTYFGGRFWVFRQEN